MELKRKFINTSPGWVGYVSIQPDGKPKGMSVGPGEGVWLSEDEERLTAEAPQLAGDNPFVATFQKPTEFNSDREPIAWETVHGMLTLSEEPAREIGSERFTPPREGQEPAPQPGPGEPAPKPAQEPEPAGDDEQTGVAPQPREKPEEGQRAPDEQVGTPDAEAANDEELARRREELTTEQKDRETVPVGAGGPAGPDAIRTPPPLPVE